MCNIYVQPMLLFLRVILKIQCHDINISIKDSNCLSRLVQQKKSKYRSSMTSSHVLAIQGWALSVFFYFCNNKNDFLHFYQVNLTGSVLFKEDWYRNRLLTL